MNKKDTQTIEIIIGAVLLIVIGYVLYRHKISDNYQLPTNLNKQNSQQAPTPQATPPTASPTTPTTTSKPLAKLDYGEAVKKYPFRFQFVNCGANPGTLNVKKGTAVMLDNRDNQTHTIKANGQTVRIAKYDYAVIYPQTVTSNGGDATVTCDGGGSGVLNVEK